MEAGSLARTGDGPADWVSCPSDWILQSFGRTSVKGRFAYRLYELFYREQGNGALLLILPGNTASSAVHARELAAFGGDYRVVALDLLGTGQSDRVARWPDDWWQQGAEAAIAWMDHLDVERGVVMGTSGGAVAALLAALYAPKRVRAVIADSVVLRQPPDVLRTEVQGRRQVHPDAVAFWRHAHGDDWEQVVEADSDLLLRLANRGGEWFDSGLAGMACPVLITGSLRDSALYNGAEQMVEMAGQIPESQLVLFNGGDHPLMWTRPAAFQRVAFEFMNGLES